MMGEIKLFILSFFPGRRKKILKECGLFDEEWYGLALGLDRNQDPIDHYLKNGNSNTVSPSPFFDAKYYSEQGNQKAINRLTFLEHYLFVGWEKGISPTPYFDPEYYYKSNNDVALERLNPLVHFLNYGWKEGRNPNPFFATSWYLEHNQDVKSKNINPLQHYCGIGYIENRRPSPSFDSSWYRKNYAINDELDPLLHFLAEGKHKGFLPNPNFIKNGDGFAGHNDLSPENYAEEIQAYHNPGPFFVDRSEDFPDWQYNLKYIAFYLPQFHEIDENNDWWGNGFTEWTNVTKGMPRFKGHFQPRLPRDLGFYDLSNIDTLKRQVEIAKQYGLFGFSFHYYWFSGRRLLKKPLDLFLKHKEIDFPFCLCWANENWTRRWDGLDQEILIKQDFTEEDLSTFMPDLKRYLEDPRYIKINGRPLIVIYRPMLIPKIQKVLESWKVQARGMGIGEPIWAAVQAFGLEDPTKIGFDVGLEFPPHKLAQNIAPVNHKYDILDPSFEGRIIDTVDVVKKSEYYSSVTEFPLIKGVFPSWDNEARKKGSGTTFVNSSPLVFKKWLRSSSQYAIEKPVFGESIVFINAWNEWAEGAYLEPDQYNGYAYLDVAKSVAKKYNTFRSSANQPSGDVKLGKANMKFLVVSHDAHRHGAQLNILGFVKTLNRQFGLEIGILLLDGGALESEFRKEGNTFCLHGRPPEKDEDLQSFLFGLELNGFEYAICNTTVSGKVIPVLKKSNFRVLSLIHELPSLIKEFRLEEYCHYIARESEKVIFASNLVKSGFCSFTKLETTKEIILPQGVYAFPIDEIDNISKGTLRKELSIDSKDKVLLSLGFADLRKGVDIFLRVANQMTSKNQNIHFVWIGNIDSRLSHWIHHDLEILPTKENIHFLPFKDNISDYIIDSDIYLLTSREDPFPTVVLEAMAFGKPVIVFEGSSGVIELNNHGDFLKVVPYLDSEAMINSINQLLENEEEYNRISKRSKVLINNKFRYDDYCMEVIQELIPDFKKISVIVPNYNYAHTLEERLVSIWDQDYPIFETIVLDDKSTDNSIEVIKRLSKKYKRTIRLFVNEKNSGSPFAQWKKGVEKARGNLVWIAEADDLSKPSFINKLLPFFEDDEVGMVYCQSEQIDENGNHLANNYLYYTDQISKKKWKNNYVLHGQQEIIEGFAVMNTILNVSSVIWRKELILPLMKNNIKDVKRFNVAGDWFLYIKALEKTKIGFCADSLNIHRRHYESVTHKLNAQRHLKEISEVHELTQNIIGFSETLQSEQIKYLDMVRRDLLDRHNFKK